MVVGKNAELNRALSAMYSVFREETKTRSETVRFRQKRGFAKIRICTRI
jgi:hypothetical protein